MNFVDHMRERIRKLRRSEAQDAADAFVRGLNGTQGRDRFSVKAIPNDQSWGNFLLGRPAPKVGAAGFDLLDDGDAICVIQPVYGSSGAHYGALAMRVGEGPMDLFLDSPNSADPRLRGPMIFSLFPPGDAKEMRRALAAVAAIAEHRQPVGLSAR